MMLLWALFMVFLKIESSFCTIECRNTEKCVCFLSANEYEFQCPPNFVKVNGFIIRATTDRIRIDCSLNIEHFELEKLPFVNIENATKLSIQFCPLPPKNFKQIIDRFSIKVLTTLSFSYSKQNGISISKEYFKDLTTLEYLNLNANQITKLEEDVFDNTPNLISINLEDNNINLNQNNTSIAPFKKLNKLTLLNLNNNSLRRIKSDLFRDLTALEILYLNKNQISYINPFAFSANGNLKEVYVAHNNYSGELNELFPNSINLEVVDFSHNKIKNLKSVIVINFKLHLKHLNFSYNHITSLIVADLQSIDHTIINLEHNDITEVNFRDVEFISRGYNNGYTTKVLLSNNPLVCDCLNYDFLRYLKGDLYSKVYDMFKIEVKNVTCKQPENTRDILFEKLRLIDITCPAKHVACPKECQCLARPYDKSYLIVNCSNGGLSTYPAIEFTPSSILNQIELHLEFNNLTSGPSSVEVEKYYSSVTRLYLSNNYIKNISSMPAKLQLLQLNNNLLEILDDGFLEYLNTSSISNLTLYGNPWTCECNQTENFAQYLLSHTEQIDGAYNIFCANTEKAIIHLNKHSLCKEWQLIALIVVIMSILVLCATTVAAYYRYQREIKVWLYSKKLCLCWVTEKEVDKDKLYDAFLCYSHKDEEFVTQNLLPVLESGPNPYKICLHIRDWIPGGYIAAQVAQSVYDSRRTIIILSPNFVESVWGMHEFKTAHTKAMEERRARVIVILHGDVDIESLDEELKAYLRTNTYLKWGNPKFWDDLQFELPHYY